jgi:uncharacterized protein YndB with AHSA1/START domain
MVPQRIEREILIDAPVDVVWAVVTEPEHITGWFSHSVQLDLRPGGAAVMFWAGHGAVHGRVERVEAPEFFSFRWALDHDVALADDNSTLVEFSLRAEGDSTRLTVVETGFADVAGTEDYKQEKFDGHTSGWEKELGELDDYLRQRTR